MFTKRSPHGVVEKKSSPLALSVWFPITRLSSKPSPHPCSQHSPETNHCIHAVTQAIHSLVKGKQLLSRSWPYRDQNDSKKTYSSPKTYQRTQSTMWGKQQFALDNEATRENLHRPHWGRKIQTPNLCMREIYIRTLEFGWKTC